MPERPLSDAARADLLDAFDGLRVADVADALDFLGFNDEPLLAQDIRPLHRDVESFSHRVVGFANTMRYLPPRRPRDLPRPEEMDFETGTAWRDEWYEEHNDEPEDVREGDVVVVAAHEMEVGIVGSANSLGWMADGAVGVVTDGGPRDTDEILKQGMPVYSRSVNRTIIPGRTELDARNVPVNVGGAHVRPEDVVVADGDGVIAVPLEWASDVADAAAREQASDQETRRRLYERAGLDADFTLE